MVPPRRALFYMSPGAKRGRGRVVWRLHLGFQLVNMVQVNGICSSSRGAFHLDSDLVIDTSAGFHNVFPSSGVCYVQL